MHVSIGQLTRMTEPIVLGKRLVKQLRAHLKKCEPCREAIRSASTRPKKIPYRVACEVRLNFPDDAVYDNIYGISDADDTIDIPFPPRNRRGEIPML